jgi:large subunit ribosomal protein L15
LNLLAFQISLQKSFPAQRITSTTHAQPLKRLNHSRHNKNTTMQLNTLTRKTPQKKSKLVGRGGKRGKTSGRGTKGQKARAGHRIRPEIRDFIKKLPKLRGRGKNGNTSIELKPRTVTLTVLDRLFSAGDTVSRQELVKRGAVKARKGVLPGVKILGDGEITKSLTIAGVALSGSAKVKIEKAGGSVTESK